MTEIDFFKVHELKEANIVEMKRMLVFTSTSDETIDVKHYEVVNQISEALILSGLKKEEKSKEHKVGTV